MEVKMSLGYPIAIIIYMIMFLCTIPYHRKLRKKLNKKAHKLFIFYGMSMFFVDRVPKKFLYRNTMVNRSIEEMCVKEDVKKEQYLYHVKKVSLCLCVILIVLVLGEGASITAGNENKNIRELKRDLLKDKIYSLMAKSETGEVEEIQINLQKKDLSNKEIKNLIVSKKEELIKEFLSDNSDVNHVSKPINLVSSIGDENIFISWEISDTDVIGYDGQISPSVSDEGKMVSVTAIMTYRKVTVDYTFSVCVYQNEQTESIASKLQALVDKNNKKDKVVLPKEIDGKKVTYYTQDKMTAQWIFPIGFVIAIALFFLKDKDLKKQIQDRKGQMEKDYPEIVSQILLYYGAGVSLRIAMERIIQSYHEEKKSNHTYFRYAYEELEISLTKIKSGISEVAAIEQFGNRCGVQCYKRLSGIMEQNLRRGTKELIYALKAELNSAMEERKNRALKEGSKISTKLLGPMVIMLIMAMVIIMVPALMSMSI